MSTHTCHCLQGWTGSTCGIQVWLTVANVTTKSVSINININQTMSTSLAEKSSILVNDLNTANSLDNLNIAQKLLSDSSNNLSFANISKDIYPFSVHYWLTRQSSVCNIVSNVTRDLTVYRLQGGVQYTFCLYTSPHDLCFPRSSELSDPRHNCINVWTEMLVDKQDKIKFYTLILSIICGVFLIILIIIFVISVRQHNFLRLICAKRPKRRNRKTKVSEIQMAKLDQESLVIELDNLNIDSTSNTVLLNSPPSSRVQIIPPRSPGKPKHQLVKERARGYAAFSAKNEQTIPLSAVVEYDETEINDLAD